MLRLFSRAVDVLVGITRRLDRLEQKTDRIMILLEELEKSVAANGDAVASAVILINGLADQVAGLKPDSAAIAALATKIRGHADALGAAVVENTPAEDPPPPPIV